MPLYVKVLVECPGTSRRYGSTCVRDAKVEGYLPFERTLGGEASKIEDYNAVQGLPAGWDPYNHYCPECRHEREAVR